MSGLGIDFGHESDAYSTSTTTTTSGFHSRTRAHMIPKKSSMNKLRGARPKTADEDARRVRIVSGEPDVLGHGAYTDEDFMSPCTEEEVKVQPHQLHSLSAAVAAMGGYTTDTATSGAETDSDQSPTLTESSVTSADSGGSGGQRIGKQAVQPGRVAAVAGAGRARPMSEQHLTAARVVQKSTSNTSLASGYRSDGASSLGRSAEISRGAGRNRVSIRGAASRQTALQARLGPKVRPPHTSSATNGAQRPASASDTYQDATSEDDETEVMVPDGFGGHTRAKQARSRPSTAAQPSPSLLERIDMTGEPTAPDTRPAAKWRVGSFYGPDGSETGRIDHENNTISAATSHAPAGSDISPSAMQSSHSSDKSSVSLARSHTSSQGPKASMMQSPSAATELHAPQHGDSEAANLEGSTKAAAQEQNRRSRTSLASVSMRSKRGLQGLEEAERGGALVSLDNYRMTYDTGLPILPHEITALDQDSVMGSVRLGAGAQTMKTSLSQGGLPTMSASVSSQLSASTTKPSGIDADAAKNGGKVPTRPRRSLSETNVSAAALLERHGTLLSTNANPVRRGKELNRLLGNSDRKLPSSAAKPVIHDGLKRSNAVGPNVAPPPAALEQGKASKARVEVDLVLESDLVVEGGTLQGRMQIRVRKGSDKEGRVLLAQPKIRVVGFEELLADDTRYIFYHHASVIDGDRSSNGPSEPYYLHGSPTLSSPETGSFSALACFAAGPDAEGYAEGKVGSHSIPFSLELPVSKGAKGSYRGKNAVVRYIVIGSVKLKSASGGNRSIAHFYRHVDLFPYLNPAVVLSSALKPIQATSSKGLFLGGSGKVHLMASLHRNTWVAGQRVYVHIGIQNETTKKINGMTLALIRTVTLYKPRPELNLDGQQGAARELDPDACQTSTTRKKIAEEELEMGQKGSRGVVTAKGWWTGVEPGQRVESSHSMHIPADALSISRGRHVEVVYSIKVSIGSALSSDVSVELPIRVINFVSLDPPPLKKVGSGKFSTDATRNWAAPGSVFSDAKSPPGASATGGDADQMVARLKSVDAMRSPGKTEISLQNYDQHQHQAARLLSPGEVAAEQTRRLQHQKSLDFINHAIRSAAARRGVDVTPTTSSSSARTPSPAGLGIGVGGGIESDSASDSITGHSPGGSSSTDDDRGDEEGDDTKTPLAATRYTSTAAQPIFPPGCEPYTQHHHAAHQAQYTGNYSQLPVTLHLPGGMHHMQQMQMQMYQMQMGANPAYVQRTSSGSAAGAGAMLPMLRINNANAVSLDEIGDDYDNDDEDEEGQANQTLALNDESMAEMNMVIGSARLDYEEFGQFDDSVQASDVLEHGDTDEHAPILGQVRQHDDTAETDGWSLRRRGSAEDGEDEAGADGDLGQEEADDVAEVSTIMQAVSIAPGVNEAQMQGSTAPPPSAASASSSTVSPVAGLQRPVAPPHIPTRGDSRFTSAQDASHTSNVTRPLKINKEAATLLPQQVIRAKVSTEQLGAKRSSTGVVPLASKTGRVEGGAQQALSAANLKRHSDNLSYRHQQQQQAAVVQSRHRSTHSVTGLKPLILKSRATTGSSAGSRTPDAGMASPRDGGVESPDSVASDMPQIGQAQAARAVQTVEGKPTASPYKETGLPRSSTLQSLAKPAPALRHSDSTSSLVSETSTVEPAGALSRSHSTHNLRGAAIMVPSVRNKIAMLESRSAALREFTGTNQSAGNSPAASPLKASASTGKVAQLAERAERACSLTPSSSARLGRKGSWMSSAESEDGAGSVVSSVMTVPEYMKTAGSGLASFNAPMLRNL